MKLDGALHDIIVTIDGLPKTPYGSSKVDADERTFVQEKSAEDGSRSTFLVDQGSGEDASRTRSESKAAEE